MKVALVNPGKERRHAVSEPLNLGYIASILEQINVEVKIVDELAGQHVKKEIVKFGPDIVGITAVTPLAPDAYRIADMCRAMGVLTVMGGVHATIMPEEALKHADIVVVGEGEMAMLDIVQQGIKTGVVSRPYTKDLDKMPPPARHLIDQDFYLHSKARLGDVVSHLYFAPLHARVATIISSRGCPYHCTFCHNSWRQAPLRFHTSGRVMAEIRQLIEKYDIDALFFMDDNLLANKPRVREICQMMIKEKISIPWGCNATANHIDPAIAKLIKDAGCQEVVFGWESGSQRILDVLEKNTRVERNSEAIKICKKAGLLVTGSFMVGNPTETIEDVEATKQFIIQNKEYIDMYGVNITTPYPGTKLWSWSKEHGLIPEQFEWSSFNQMDLSMPACDTMTPKEIERLALETFSIQNVKLGRLWMRALWHPLRTLIWGLKYPSLALKVLVGTLHTLRGKH